MVPAYDPPWDAKAPAATTTATSSGSDPQTAQQLQSLVNKLQSNDQSLSPQEIQHIIAETTGTKITSKSMHQAVKKVDLARAKFKAAKAARLKLHNSWTAYVEESVKRWRTFAEDFTKKDTTMEEELNKAREALQEARRHLDATKEQHSKQDAEELEETETISDGEAEDENMKVDTAAMIQKRIHSVVESLEQIQIPSTDDTADPKGEAASKRQRLDASAGLGSRALSPFPGPGK
jgi:ACT domain-containing protein